MTVPYEILRRHQADLREPGVKSQRLFGSVVRGEVRPLRDCIVHEAQHDGRGLEIYNFRYFS
jgi:predicted nucleotidyltransferase